MTFAATHARRAPKGLALADAHRRLTWSEADEMLRPAVNRLLGADLGERRRVAVFAENSVDTVLAHAAITLAGGSAVPVNFHLTAPEAAYIFEDSGAALVLADGRNLDTALEAARLAGVDLVVAWYAPNAPVRWEEWLATGPDDEPPTNQPPQPSLVYTSGTTGRPKGVVLPPSSFVGGDDIAEHVATLAENRMIGLGPHLAVGPLYHSGPLTATRLFLGGAPVVVLGRFDAEATLRAIEEHRIASTIMVPTHFIRLLDLPREVRDSVDVSSLTYVRQVGAACPIGVKRAMIDWWGPVLYESYGGSEVGTCCSITSQEWLEHPGSVGRARAPFEVLVVDDAGGEVPTGTPGRLYFRDRSGRGLVYEGDADKTAAAHLEPGVFTLGEVGFVDEYGYVFITDRISDMIVSGGVNIYPAEAEQVLGRHPGIADVACIGVPSADMGEELKALVVPTGTDALPDPAEVLTWCRERLTHYKCPRTVELVEDLGRSALGKLDRARLRTAWEEHRIQTGHTP